jgi:hypothetical protein
MILRQSRFKRFQIGIAQSVLVTMTIGMNYGGHKVLVGGQKQRITESKVQSGKNLLKSGPLTNSAQSGSFYSDALPLAACIRKRSSWVSGS